MKDVSFKLSYYSVRLLLLHRTNYRSSFSQGIRNVFKRLNLCDLYDSHLWSFIELPEVLFRKRVSALYKKEMVEIFNTMSEYLPAKPLAILDIGAGMGGIDLVLYHHYNNKPNLYLLDKDGVSEKINAGFNKTAEDFSHYNSFAHAKLFLTDNNVPADHIHTINISSEAFPTEQKFDLVISLLSWGFHYPISTYVQEVYDSLQSGGSLIIDVRKDTDGISELTKMFNSTPETIYEENKFVRVAVRKK